MAAMVRRFTFAAGIVSGRSSSVPIPVRTAKNGREPTDFYIRLQLLLLPPSRRHQLLKLMATRRHLMATVAAPILRIASNTIEIEVSKLRLFNFKYC